MEFSREEMEESWEEIPKGIPAAIAVETSGKMSEEIPGRIPEAISQEIPRGIL